MGHEGHRKRMRDRALKYGFEVFHDHELLEFMLYGAVPRKNTNELAHKLIETFGSFDGVLDAQTEQLLAVDGVGEAVAAAIASYAAANRRYVIRKSKQKKTLKTIGNMREYFMPFLQGLLHEEFHIVFLDSKNQILRHERFAGGTTNKIHFSMDKICDLAAIVKPRSVVCAHNHPSGNVQPSLADLQFTQHYMQVLSVGNRIALLDHLIFSDDGKCYSFRQDGELDRIVGQLKQRADNIFELCSEKEIGGYCDEL